MIARRLAISLAVTACTLGSVPARAGDPPSSGASASAGPVARTASSGPLTVRLVADHAEIPAAGQVRLTLTVSTPEGFTVALPKLEGTLGEFSIASRTDAAPKLENARFFRESVLTLEPFLPGQYTIPPLEIGYARVGTTESGTARTEPLTITVTSALPADAKLEVGPARDVVAPRKKSRPLAVTISISAGSAMLATLISNIMVKRAKRRAGAPLASSRLAELRQRVERREATVRDICDQAPAALRAAFASRIEGAMAMTTEQLLSAAPGAHVTAHELDQLREFLRRCDAARYAGEAVDSAELVGALDAMSALAAHLEAAPSRSDGVPRTRRGVAGGVA